MSQEVASLVRQRAVIKSRLTNFKKFLDACTVDSLDDAAICELEQKVERINLANEEFAGIQCQIESLVEDLEEQITERDLVENSFDRYLGIAKSLLVNTKSEVRSGNSGRSSANSSRPSNSRYRGGGEGASVNVDIRLPKIELPKFSGDASSWVEFREIYNSLIHFNENISDIQKFHYLKAALQKDAANAIQCIDFTAANYKNAYDAVIERYDNVRLLTHNHVHAIFSISPITKETADEIRRIIDTVSKHLKSLEQLGEQVDTWDTLIIYVIASKLDKFSLREWEKYASHLSNKPNLKDIREFLKSRAGILEALEAKASQDRVGKGRQAASTSKGLVSTTGSKCLACDQNHSIQNCPAFQKLNVSQRYEKLKEKKACMNCLRLGHFSRQCRASGCKRCSAKHNTLLHFEKTNSSVPENSEQTPATLQTATAKSEPPATAAASAASADAAACLSSYATPDHALLSTAIVEISDKDGNPCQGRAVLDSGSQSNYITKEFCNRLGIPVTNVHFALSGINENALIAKAKCNVDLRSRINNFCRSLTFYVLPTITGDVPMIKVNRSECTIHWVSLVHALSRRRLCFNFFGWKRLSGTKLSLSLHTSWCKLRDDLPSLNELAIPRKVISANAWKIELHGFSDSSKDAYGGCLYVRSIDKDGSIEVHLLCSKSKVAPLKTISIPRLELCAALVLSRLADKVRKSLNLTFDRCILWSDSSVVLGWLNHSPGALKTFVANRVSEIQTLTSDSQWRYIGTKDNPADLVSRGAYPHELSSKSIWWNGPEFLSKPEACWPESKFTVPNLPEINVTSKTLVANSEFADSLFNRYSSLSKLKRVVAYILRFRYLNSMAGTCKGSLTVVELNRALLCLVKLAQMSSFCEERRNLIKGTGLNPKSRLLNLSPFLDEHGVIRVGGRLKNSNYRFEKVHPILLCSKHPLAVLIVKFEHQISYHAGPQALLATVRERYWILSGRRLCKDIINKCVVCRKQKAQILSPIMGQLPKSRFDCNFPFEICGVDYAGPF
nr:unnamed protein product [Callosobruchus analis]